MSDEALVAAIVEQDRPELFAWIYRRYVGKIQRKCSSFTHDREVAQDMAQDIMVKVYHQLCKFSGKSRFSTWLYAITYNFCVEHYRKQGKFHFLAIDQTFDLCEDMEDPEPLQARSSHLHHALEKIAPEDRAILLMKYQQDLSIKELTERFQISDSAVKMRLARARQRVKDLIQESERHAA